MQWRHAVLLTLALTVVGCSSNNKKEFPLTELTDFKEEVVLSKQWSRSINDGQGDLYNLLEPAVDGFTIYAASAEGRVTAIQRETGGMLWKKDLERPVSGGVDVGYGPVLVGALRGDMITLDGATDKKKWIKRISSEVLSAPATNDDVVVMQTQNDKLIGLDAAGGDQHWVYESTAPVLTPCGTGAPLVAGSMALAGLASGKVVAVDVQHGLPIWRQRVAIPRGRSGLGRVMNIDGGLLLSGGALYVISYQDRTATLDVNSGRLLWQRKASGCVGVAEGFDNIYVNQASGSVGGLDSHGASSLWNSDALARRQLSAPAVFSSSVVVDDLEGYVHLSSQADGRFVGRERIDSDGVRVRPLVVGSWMYVFGNGGKPVAYTIC